MINIKYEIEQTLPGIFTVKVQDDYQRAMRFLRCQEHYESQFEEIKGSHFDIFEYMERYAKWRGSGSFTYPSDWSGFNVPDYAVETSIKHVLDLRNGIFPTPYDYVMSDIIEHVKSKIKRNSKWYLLGVDSFESRTMMHETAHGLYYVSRKYNGKARIMVQELPTEIFGGMKDLLLKMGYCDGVIADEIQAYMSTGLTSEMAKITGIQKYLKGFEKHFKKYNV